MGYTRSLASFIMNKVSPSNRINFSITGSLIAGGARYLYLDKLKAKTRTESQLTSLRGSSPDYEPVLHWNVNWDG